MFDARARSYEADTEIADVDDWQDEPPVSRRRAPTLQPIALGRVPTEDLDVHVRDANGNWHRLHPNKLVTACGAQWTNWGHENQRSGRYPVGPLAAPELCDCWTKAERAESAALDEPIKGCVP